MTSSSYGAVDDQDEAGSSTVGGGARTPLLAKPLADVADVELDEHGRKQGSASLASCIGNLDNTIIGSGMLSFPLAMASAGIIPGILTCLFSASAAAFGLYLLSRCATRAPHRHASFFAISELTFPRAAVFLDLAIATKCFGVSISYLIIIKGLMPSVVASIFHVLTPAEQDPPAWTQDGRSWMLVFGCLLVPLCFLRKLDSLRHTSYVSLFSVTYLILVVIVCFVRPPAGAEEPGDIHWVNFTPAFVSNFPVQVFAFTCAQNLFPVYNELWTNSQKRMNTVIGTSIGFAAGVYELIAIIGYLTFGSKVGPNIIANYPNTSLFIAGAQLAIVVNVMCSYPLQVHPCRNCLDKVFQWQSPTQLHHRIQGEDEPEVEDEWAPDVMSTWKHALLTAGIVCAGYAIAWNVDDLKLVFSFVGSTGSTTISFILPGLFYYKLFKDEQQDERKWIRPAALALAIYGFLVMIFCLSFNIYSVLHPAVGAPADFVRRFVLVESVMAAS